MTYPRILPRSADVLAEVGCERVRQDRKWGEQNHPDGTGPTIPSLNAREHAIRECDYAAKKGTLSWRHILEEEYREALAESDPAKLRIELVQVAAVAVSWVEAIDRRLTTAPAIPAPEGLPDSSASRPAPQPAPGRS